MIILEKFKDFSNRLDEAQEIVENIENERINYCRENIKEIKKIMPNCNKIYKVLNPKGKFRQYENDDEYCYFKVTNTRFDFRCQFRFNDQIYPDVKGEIYDVNMRKLDFYEPTICITELHEVIEKPNTKNQITSIYLMIDNNTGYYKIGRSKNPKIRESTLQSEKPTIQMIFNIEGKVHDEKALHDMYSDKRIRGEWFDLNGSDIIQIKKYFNINI
jgi:hypothetical protein